ncbi:MAG: FeMo cofactor biosynthesis protein NifB [Pelotomaculum sp. PtaU1.Bin035]|nr:MAG: FeMo cofactor biosynthesis protein NifB [Pelotomaculum sp. PtaU1.Bin035]
MSYKVAVASSDGKFVNQHFGRASQFLIFEIKDDGGFFFLVLRDNTPPCDGGAHNSDLLARTVDLISDCRVVLVSQIGPGAIDALLSRGIQPHVIPDFIEDALKRLIPYEGALKKLTPFRHSPS